MTKFDDNFYKIIYKGSELINYRENLSKCWNCGDLTHWFDTNFYAFLCSQECEEKKWEEYFNALRGY